MRQSLEDNKTNYRWKGTGWLGGILTMLTVVIGPQLECRGQTPWEYNPYRVNVWISVSPNLGWSEASEIDSHRSVLEKIETSFGGVWSARVQSTPDSLYGSVLYRIDELTVQQVLAREMTVVVGKSDKAKAKFLEANPPPPPVQLSPEEKAKRDKMSKQELQELNDAEARAASLNSVRTFDSVLERIDGISILALPYSGMQRDIVPFLAEPKWKKFSEKLKANPGNLASLEKELEEGTVLAALVGKSEASLIKGSSRIIPARLPWQPESLLRDYDKIYLTSVDRVGEMYRVRVKELDSMIRRLGPLGSMMVSRRDDIPTAIEHLLRKQFNPTVRIEENDNSTALVRIRAAGLINRDQHPARIDLGDGLIPYIRRDDSNGNPTLIQALPFTYIIATEKVDQLSLLYGAIFTARKGALTAAKNRRTVRVALKVPEVQGGSELQLTFRQTRATDKVAVPGAEVFLRTPGHDDLVMLGRTDWRGNIPIVNDTRPIIKYDVPTLSRNPSIAEARSLVSDPVPPPDYPKPVVEPSVVEPPKKVEPAKTEEGSETPKKKESEGEALAKATADASQDKEPEKPIKGEIKANIPLYLYYIKNGDTLLARLPIVSGMQSLEEAKLPDDRKRLDAEAFLKGVQNDVLDTVIRRKILETRIKTRLDQKKRDEAMENLQDMKRLKSYEKLFTEVETIQRKALVSDAGKTNPTLVTKVENMVNSTRQMIQTWLQTTMINDLEKRLDEGK
jgi:hypothetical protein